MDLHHLPQRQSVHLADIRPRFPFLTRWERHRHGKAHWIVEMAAECMAVFLYVYAGLGATASFVVGNLTDQVLGSLLSVGFAFAVGIILAIVTCAGTSGGHFSPAITISFVIFRGFPLRKAARYIFAQILGAFIAALLVYSQWHDIIREVEAVLVEKGTWDSIMFTPSGLAGIFATYASPGANLGPIFLNEFVVDFVLGITVWACLDPTNFIVPPSSVPFVISSAYAMAIWGYAPVGISTNTARDIGTRLAVMCIWGTKAAGGSYAAIAALTNIPATLAGALFYEFFLVDSSRVITPAHVDFLVGHVAHEERKATEGMPHSIMAASQSSLGNGEGKARTSIQAINGV